MKNRKTKIKKYSGGRVAFFFFIGLLLGAAALCGVYYALAEHTDINWRSYIEEKLIPEVLAVIAAIGTASLALKPIISNIALTVNAVADRFKSATDDVNATVMSSAKSEEEVYAAIQNLAKLQETIDVIHSLTEKMPELERVIDNINSKTENMPQLIETVESIDRGVADNTEISKLGFGSMIELTKSGASKKIMRIGRGAHENEKAQS